MSLNKSLIFLIVLMIAIMSLLSCSKQKMLYKAVAMESSDECHLCGMLITRFDGPKGEVFLNETGDQVYKYCSTYDLLSYYLDPENRRHIVQIFVHDMSKMPWESDSINDNYFIDAKAAWFVVGSVKMGAMGETLASFSLQTDAQAFAKEFGGKVINFTDITYDTLM
jgi:copper chaperone NosL